jgi:hypothetical protein
LAEILAPGRLTGSRDIDTAPTPFLPTFVAGLDDANYQGGAYGKLGAAYGYHASGQRFMVYDQATMTEVGLLTDTTNFGSALTLELNDAETRAFVACESGASVTVLDISNKAAPAFVQRFRGPTAGTSLNGANGIARDGNVLAVSCYTRDSVAFIDCTDPDSLVWISEFRGTTPGTTLNQCRRVSLDPVNKICYYVCDSTSANVHRFGAIDYSTPASPVELWFLATADVDTARGAFWDPDHNLIWTCSSGGTPFFGALTAYQVDPENLGATPSKVGQYKGLGPTFSHPDSITATRSVAFVENGGSRYAAVVAESPNSITVLDVTDPANIFRVGVRKDPSRLNIPLGIEIGVGGHAYVTSLASNGQVGTRGVTKWDLHLI